MFNHKIVNKNLLIIIPSIIAFFIGLIPTLQYGWPLSWDIIHHVHIAEVYAQYGFTLTDPLISLQNGPQKIGYVPLFHLFIAAIGYITKINYFQIARCLQPLIAAGIVFSVSYVGYKFYGLTAGISAGFIILSSNLVNRIVLPIPENIALIIFPIAVYLFYISLKKDTYKYALISGLMFILMVSIHQSAAFLLFLTITSFIIVKSILSRDICVFKKYIAWILPPVCAAVIALTAVLILDTSIIHNILQNGIGAVTGYKDSISYNYNQPLDLIRYVWQLGIIALLFALIGAVASYKLDLPKAVKDKSVLLIVWIVVMFIFSKINWFGLNMISYRVLIYILLPLSILGGFGLYQTYKWGKQKKISNLPVGHLILGIIFLFATLNGVLIASNPKIANFGAQTELGNISIAPPSVSEIDLASWFSKNGDKNKRVVISNYYSGMFLVADTGQPLSRYNRVLIGKVNQSTIIKKDIGYLVYDKRLKFSSGNKTYRAEPGGLLYFSRDIRQFIPKYAKIVYENNDFIVCKVQSAKT
ncbi:hypothetical protein [Methanobacterium sp.]|uniref:hypothetical protein n=1 Tax=Methanobacterium sp. TaxID=2164 RepID=UPI003157F2D1